MAELLINQGELLHTVLSQQTQRNISRIKEIQDLAKEISQLFSGFSNSINAANRMMFKKLKFDEEEDPSIIFLSKFTIDLLGQMNKKLNMVNKKVKNEVIDPLEQFCQSQKDSYIHLRERSAQLFTSIEANASFLNELNKNFNANQTTNLTDQEREDFKKIYQCEMQKCNQNWLSIKQGYKKLLNETDSTNSFRCNFTIKMQVKICKFLNKIVGSPHTQEVLTGYEQICDQNESLSIYIKQRIRDVMGKSILLQQKSMQEFDGVNQFAYKQKSIIDDFISMFISFSNLKQDETKHEKARTLILSNFHWATYFLNRLRSNLHTEIKLNAIKYHEMTTILKYLFATCAEQDNNEHTIYNIMYISYRMSHNSNYIIKQLGKHESYWQNANRWYNLIEYLKNARKDSFHGKKFTNNQKIKKAVKDGLNWIITQPPHRVSTEKKIRSERMIADARAYDILCEMNYFMSRLELKQKFIFDFIIEASTYFGLTNQNTRKLLKFHYFNKQNINTKTNSNYAIRKKRIEDKYKYINREQQICICVGKSLQFLQANSELLKLRLVNSMWAKQLKNKIAKRFLIQEKNEDYLNRIRLKVYSGFCPSILTENIFKRMIEELPDFTQHSDIIKLDARRSLAWDESLRQGLIQILKCFAFYHPNVGYLQGMNYLCQNILKLTDFRFEVYRIFEYLMNNPFYGMYSANFDGLRTKIYQFMRILQREKPKLYDHFQTQKLQGEHFVLPWAITLWGEMSGQLCWVMWDGFICKGWKWWFKTLLWLINILQPELLNMNFQQMMKCFSQLNTGLLNMNSQELKDFGIDIIRAKYQIDKVQIHTDLLKQLQKQYKTRVQMINQYLSKLNQQKNRR